MDCSAEGMRPRELRAGEDICELRASFSKLAKNESGSIDAFRLASAIGISVEDVAAALSVSVEAIKSEPDAEAIQFAASLLLGVASDLAGALGDASLVQNYLQTRQPDFNNRTPIEILKAGQLKFLCGYIGELVTLRPD